jgi:signal transduction histidine kinase
MTQTTGSLRVRLLSASALSLATALTLAFFALTAIFERHVERRIEHELENHLRQISALVETTADGQVVVAGVLSDPRFERPFSGLYWQIEEAGKVLDSSASLGDETLKLPTTAAGGPKPFCVEAPGPGGKLVLLVTRDIIVRVGEADRTLRLTAALDHAEIDNAVEMFRWDTALSLSILGACLALAAWLQVSVGLRPLTALRRRLSGVRQGQDARLTGPFPNEISPLVDDLNGLLEAQERSIQRARTRASDLAHGLKTPLTILNGAARELAVQGQSSTAGDIAEQVTVMRHHVERELARARIASARTPRYADVVTIVSKIISTMQRLPRGEELDWQMDIAEGSVVALEADDLAEILGNLLENASKWANSVVRISADPTDHKSTLLEALTVEDDGNGVPEAQLSNVLERGVRLDPSKRGTGLGLAIATDIAEAYGGSLRLFRSPLGGLGVRIIVTADMPAVAEAQPLQIGHNAPLQLATGEL